MCHWLFQQEEDTIIYCLVDSDIYIVCVLMCSYQTASIRPVRCQPLVRLRLLHCAMLAELSYRIVDALRRVMGAVLLPH